MGHSMRGRFRLTMPFGRIFQSIIYRKKFLPATDIATKSCASIAVTPHSIDPPCARSAYFFDSRGLRTPRAI